MRKTIRIIVVGVVLAALIIGYYYYLSNRNNSARKDEDKAPSEYTVIKEKNLAKDYPETPRAVVKFYNRIITEYYAKDHSEKQIGVLAKQARRLFDEDLQAKNPTDTFIESVETDISDWKKREASIKTSKVCSSNDISYTTVDGRQCAYVYAYYFTKDKNGLERTYQEYCLRQDSDGKWKILTWRVISEDQAASYDFS